MLYHGLRWCSARCAVVDLSGRYRHACALQLQHELVEFWYGHLKPSWHLWDAQAKNGSWDTWDKETLNTLLRDLHSLKPEAPPERFDVLVRLLAASHSAVTRVPMPPGWSL